MGIIDDKILADSLGSLGIPLSFSFNRWNYALYQHENNFQTDFVRKLPIDSNYGADGGDMSKTLHYDQIPR